MQRTLLLLTYLMGLLASPAALAAIPACVWVTDTTGTARLLDLATAQEVTAIPNFSASRAAMLDDDCALWTVAADGVTLRQHAADGSLVASENLGTVVAKNKKIQQLRLTRHPATGYRTTLHDGVKLLRREMGAPAFTAFASGTTPLAVDPAADVGATGAGTWELTAGALAYYTESGTAGVSYPLAGLIATPTQLVVDPLLNQAWIGGADGLLLLDLGSGQSVRKIALTKTVEALAWDNRNGLVWARTLQATTGSGQNKTYSYAVTSYAPDGTSPGSVGVTTNSTANAPSFAVLPSTSQLAVGTPDGLKLYNPQGELQVSHLAGQVTLLAAPSLVPRPEAEIAYPSGTTRAAEFEVVMRTRCAGDDCVLPTERLAAREAAYAVAASTLQAATPCIVPLTRAPDSPIFTGPWPAGCVLGDGAMSYSATLNGRPLTGSEPDSGLYRIALNQPFVRDTTAPVISNLSPADGSVIKSENPTTQLTGQTDDASAVTVLGQAETLAAEGANPQVGQSFQWSITLQPGQNTAALTSLDPAGNGSSAQTTVTYIPTGTATWRFTVPAAGQYEITAKWIGQGSPASAVYRVQHADGIAVVSAAPSASATLSLGSYRFLAGVTYAALMDSAEGSGTTVADAVSATPREAGFNIFADQLGTPRVVTDEAGQEVWRWEQDEPYGTNPSTGSLEMPLRFPGQVLDPETGLHYNYFRDYDPGTGRYVESDPIGLEGGLNTYSYVRGNPLIYVDPLGLWSLSIEFYDILGGGITYGRDPNTGQGYITGRIGIGVGGGISYDPNGGRPGGGNSNACPENGGVTAGLYGQAGGQLGVGGLGVSGGLQLGTGYDYGSDYTYRDKGLSGSLGYDPSAKSGAGIGGAIGIEIGIYDKDRRE